MANEGEQIRAAMEIQDLCAQDYHQSTKIKIIFYRNVWAWYQPLRQDSGVWEIMKMAKADAPKLIWRYI